MKKKRYLTVFLFVILGILTGCGKDNGLRTLDKEQSEEQLNPGGMEQVEWTVSHSSMLEPYETAAIEKDKIYACRYQEGGLAISVFAVNPLEQIEAYEVPGVTELKSISINASEEICLFGRTENGDTLWKVSPKGDICTIEDIEVEELGELPSLKNFYADSNGFYYLWYEMSVPCAEVYENGEEDIYTRLDRIYVKDEKMNTILYEQIPDSNFNKLLSLAFDEDDTPILLAEDADGYYVRKLRTAKEEKYEPCRLETEALSSLEKSGIIAYTREGLLYTREGSLRLYHMSDSRDEKILELASAGILEEDIIYLGMRDGKVEIVDNYKGFEQSEYTVIEEGESQRREITIGLMSLQPEMKEVITFFNRYQNEMTVKPIIYVDDVYKDYDEGNEKLKLDIIQGKAPDLFSVDGLDTDILIKAGAFADLYTFMREDAELGAENLVPSVLKAYETEGQLYTIGSTFRTYTMWGAGSVVKGRNGMDMEDMIQLLEDNGGDINSIYGFSADESVLTTLCSFHMDKFINWNAGTCDFTGQEFQKVIQFVKEYKGTSYESLYQAIQKKDLLFTLGLINSVENYRLWSEIYGERVEFIGYPTEEGSGSAVLFGDAVAINSKSAHQEEAWEFVRFFVQKGYHGTGFPLLKEQFDNVLRESRNPMLVEDEEGKVEKVAKEKYSERDVIDIQVFQCEEEDAAAIRALVDGVSDKFRYHLEIQKIIEEEAEAYLQNQKSMEEVCRIIQNRVQLYLDER